MKGGSNITTTVDSGTVGSVYNNSATVVYALPGNGWSPPAHFPERLFDSDDDYGPRLMDLLVDTLLIEVVVSSSLRVFRTKYISNTHNDPYWHVNKTFETDAIDDSGDGWQDLSPYLTFPFTLTDFGANSNGNNPYGNPSHYFEFYDLEVDGVLLRNGNTIGATPEKVVHALDSDISLNTVATLSLILVLKDLQSESALIQFLVLQL